MTHMFEFPGKSLENLMDSYVDEYWAIQFNKTVFIEVKRPQHPWIFNLDTKDKSKFYQPSEFEMFKLPYMLNDMDDRESFFDYNFTYNLYWKSKNFSPRDYFDQTYLEKNLYEELVKAY